MGSKFGHLCRIRAHILMSVVAVSSQMGSAMIIDI